MRFFLFALCLTLLPASPASSDESTPSLLTYDLKSLEEPEIRSLTRYRGKPIVMVFFQPDCNWCAKQIRAINELHEQCQGDFGAIAIGVSGSRSELRSELRRLRPDFPAYQASPHLIEQMGGVETTPVLLLGDSDGRFVDWASGFIPLEQLRAFIGASLRSGLCVPREPVAHLVVPVQ